MPIAGQAPLVTILGAKDQTLTYQSLLLCELTWSDGSTLFLSSENLDATTGGFPYNGNDYLPRISQQTLGALQSVSDNGIIQLPSITINMADADGFLWNEFELVKGFKGAKLVLKLVFWDPDTTTFSNDYQIKFVGVCNAPDTDESYMTMVVTNIIQLPNFNLPTTSIQQICPNNFPTTHAQRVAAALDPSSQFFACGYSPDVNNSDGPGGTAAAVGNNDSSNMGQPFTQCSYTWQDCIARLGNAALPTTTSNPQTNPVQIMADQSGRKTGRFSGIRWFPPNSWRGVAYISGNQSNGIDDANQTKYTDYFPMVYGTQFVQPPIMNVVGDPNGTSFEVVLCVGQIATTGANAGPIQMVLVNDIIVPYIASSPDPTQLAWSWVSLGNRDGNVNPSPVYNGQGDPYGSLACIAIRVPIQVQSSNSLPNVQVLMSGPQIRVWNSADPTDFTYAFTQNPAWIILDILTYCGLTIDNVDLQSFVDAAKVADVSVTYTDLTGTAQQHPRYQTGITLRNRRPASEIITNMLNAFKAMLAPNGGISTSTTGKIQLYIKQTLADQQPVPFDGIGVNPAGGNDLTPYSSASGDDSGGSITTLPGYVAYHFDESNILRVGDRSTPSTFKIEQRKIRDTPNRLTISFQDEDNNYVTDSVTIVDSLDIGRTGQQVSGSAVAGEGILNFDQAKRSIQCQMAEQYRGNPRSGIGDGSDSNDNDSGGTWLISFDASYRAVHLRVGHIISISMAKYQLVKQPFRVLSIAPSANWERATLRAQWHEDDWYLDSYGQSPDPILQAAGKVLLARPPFGWLPDVEAPMGGDALFDPTDKSFAIAQLYSVDAAQNPLLSLQVQGYLPINGFSNKSAPPFAPSATFDISGGMVAGGQTYWLALCAVDSGGNLSTPSNPIASVVAPASGGGVLTLVNIYWPGESAGYALYGGQNPNRLSLQSSSTGTPDNVSISTFKVSDQAMPDVQFDHLELQVRKVWHSGVFGSEITVVGTTTLKVDASGFTTNQWAGRSLSVIGQLNSSGNLPIWDLPVTANTSDTFTIGAVTDMTTMLHPGDVVVMRAYANISSANTIGDSSFINAVNYYSPPVGVIGTSGSPIILELSTPYDGASGDEVFVKGVLGNTAANGITTIVVIDSLHIQLVGVTPNGDYSGGGTLQEITHGMRAHEEKSRIVIIIAGTGEGQQATIADNDETTLTINGQWGVIPDATSVFIIVDSTLLADLPSKSYVSYDATTLATLQVPVSNYAEQVLMVQVFTASAGGKQSMVFDSPFREIYVFGGPGNNAVDYYNATINAYVNLPLAVADDVSMHYIVRKAGTPLNYVGQLKTPCIGADTIVDIIIDKFDGSYTGTIFTSPLVIPAGSTDPTTPATAFIDNLHFDEQDVLTENVTQVGSTQPGQGLVATIKIQVD